MQLAHFRLVCSGRARLITAHNVVGKISNGKQDDKKQAIILSAHFDHVGTAGESIYLGSVDNATWLTDLIKLASILNEVSETFVEEYDAEKYGIAEKPTSNLRKEMNIQRKSLNFGV